MAWRFFTDVEGIQNQINNIIAACDRRLTTEEKMAKSFKVYQLKDIPVGCRRYIAENIPENAKIYPPNPEYRDVITQTVVDVTRYGHQFAAVLDEEMAKFCKVCKNKLHESGGCQTCGGELVGEGRLG